VFYIGLQFAKSQNTQNMNEYHVILPSNSEEQNTTSDFRVRLPYQLDLPGEWEVGLTEVQYPHTWKTITEANNKIWCIFNAPYFRRNPIYITIPPGHYGTIEELVNVMSLSIKRADRRTVKKVRAMVEATKDKSDAAQQLVAKIEKNKPVCDGNISFRFDKVLKRVSLKLNTDVVVRLYMTKHLQYILGYGDQTMSFMAKKNMAEYPPDCQGGFSNIFIYCSGIEHQIVGNTLVPLLRVVPVTGSFGDIIERIYDNPHYVGCLTKSTDSINITIKDDRNELVKFQFGKIILKLHFRKKRPFRR